MGRLSTVYFIKVVCFVSEVNNIFNVLSCCYKLVGTRRSTVLCLPLQLDFCGYWHKLKMTGKCPSNFQIDASPLSRSTGSSSRKDVAPIRGLRLQDAQLQVPML
jgi:hypothetical protein